MALMCFRSIQKRDDWPPKMKPWISLTSQLQLDWTRS